MIHLSLLFVGFILGVFSAGLLIFLAVLHWPRYVAATKRRKNRDRPERPAPVVHEAEVGGIRYEHLGMTGLEE